jgi:hypothetical protein
MNWWQTLLMWYGIFSVLQDIAKFLIALGKDQRE